MYKCHNIYGGYVEYIIEFFESRLLNMFLNLLQGAGTIVRFAILPIENRQLDRDKLHEPVVRDRNIPLERVFMLFDRS